MPLAASAAFAARAAAFTLEAAAMPPCYAERLRLHFRHAMRALLRDARCCRRHAPMYGCRAEDAAEMRRERSARERVRERAYVQRAAKRA